MLVLEAVRTIYTTPDFVLVINRVIHGNLMIYVGSYANMFVLETSAYAKYSM